MSSPDFSTTTNRRLQPGWRRLRIDGHLYEAPTRREGRHTITETHGAVHTPDCPKCATG